MSSVPKTVLVQEYPINICGIDRYPGVVCALPASTLVSLVVCNPQSSQNEPFKM